MIRFAVAIPVVCWFLASAITGAPQGTQSVPAIPRTWDDEAMRSLEVPLARAEASPQHISSDYYYRIPVRPVFRSYPVYRPDREPSGYFARLEAQDPQIVFDAQQLNTEQDWIAAGQIVFAAPIEFVSSGQLFAGVRDPAWYDANDVPTTRDGILPFMHYVVREKGRVELGILSCAMCHTRAMPDGTTIGRSRQLSRRSIVCLRDREGCEDRPA